MHSCNYGAFGGRELNALLFDLFRSLRIKLMNYVIGFLGIIGTPLRQKFVGTLSVHILGWMRCRHIRFFRSLRYKLMNHVIWIFAVLCTPLSQESVGIIRDGWMKLIVFIYTRFTFTLGLKVKVYEVIGFC